MSHVKTKEEKSAQISALFHGFLKEDWEDRKFWLYAAICTLILGALIFFKVLISGVAGPILGGVLLVIGFFFLRYQDKVSEEDLEAARARFVRAGHWVQAADEDQTLVKIKDDGYFYPPKEWEGYFQPLDSEFTYTLDVSEFLEEGAFEFKVTLFNDLPPTDALKDFLTQKFDAAFDEAFQAYRKMPEDKTEEDLIRFLVQIVEVLRRTKFIFGKKSFVLCLLSPNDAFYSRLKVVKHIDLKKAR